MRKRSSTLLTSGPGAATPAVHAGRCTNGFGEVWPPPRPRLGALDGAIWSLAKRGPRTESIERNGRHDETRTPDLYRVNDLQQPRGLPMYAEVEQDIAFCGLGCGFEFFARAAL